MGLVPDAKVTLQEEPFDISKYPATVSLIAVSNKHGYYAAARLKVIFKNEFWKYL